MENLSTSNLHTDLGRIGYQECLELQLKLLKLRKGGKIGDIMLFLEHDPPVFTTGRKSNPINFGKVNVVATDRGGDVTYHSPGQLVVYLIFNIESDGKRDVRKFVHAVESAIMESIARFGYDPYVGDEPGIWIKQGNKKVASIGMAIDGFVSYHGFSLNFTDEPLEGFRQVNPCGLDPGVMGYVPVDRNSLIGELLKNFGSRFGNFIAIDKNDLEEAVRKLNA
ncbi:MAG: lipoyl(octanoyl) transferase LipB [Thermoplasmataceae archaeon]